MPVKLSKDSLAEFGRRVSFHYKKGGYRSQGDLANRLTKAAGRAITRQMVFKWMRGEVYASPENREVLAREFAIPVAEITIHEAPHRVPSPDQMLSHEIVPFRVRPDKTNPALVRAEMSMSLTVEQADKIMAILYPKGAPRGA